MEESITEKKLSESRKERLEQLRKTILGERLIETNPSLAGINSHTRFEEHPSLFFGMGGGSWKKLSDGLPFDVLSMILVGQKLKQTLELGQCYIFLANKTTCINGFSQEIVDRIMIGQKELLEIALRGLGIESNWTVFLETELGEVLGAEAETRCQSLIAMADKAPFIGNHYYAREAAVTLVFGGVKIGWYAKGMKNDEQSFDKRTTLFAKHSSIPNMTSYIYTPAGIRICSNIVERVPPYILLQHPKRICLSHLENPIAKVKKGGGLWSKPSRKLFGGTTHLYQELIGKEIPISEKQDFIGQGIAERIDFILQHIFSGFEAEVEQIWKKAFQTTL